MRENENIKPTHEEAIPTPTVTTDKFGGTEVSHFGPSGSRFSATASAETPSASFNNPETIAPLTSSPVVDDNLTDGSNISRASLNYFKGEELASKIWVTKKSHSTESNGGYTLGGTLRSAFRMLRGATGHADTEYCTQGKGNLLYKLFHRVGSEAKYYDKLSFYNESDTQYTYKTASNEKNNVSLLDETLFDKRKTSLSVDKALFNMLESSLFTDETLSDKRKTSLSVDKALFNMLESSLFTDETLFDKRKTSLSIGKVLSGEHNRTLSLSGLILEAVRTVSLLFGDLLISKSDISDVFEAISDYEETILLTPSLASYELNISYTHPALFARVCKVRLANLDRHLSAYITILYKGVTVDKAAGRAPPFL